MSDKRLEDLEVKVAYLEHQLAELDGLVRELFSAHAEQRKELEALRERPEDSLTIGPGIERPPHY